jgi:hypothetical protein
MCYKMSHDGIDGFCRFWFNSNDLVRSKNNDSLMKKNKKTTIAGGVNCGCNVEPEVTFCEGQQKKENMKMSLKLLAVGLCATGLFTGMAAQADIVAFAPPALNFVPSEGLGNDGLFFTPTVDISVTSLGYVQPGTTVGNPVGLYIVGSDTLLVSTLVNNSATLVNGFYYQSITPVTLTAGVEYAVVGNYSGAPAQGFTADSGVGAAAEINFIGYEYDSNGSLDLPTIGWAPPIFGPNFEYTPVPEPTTIISGVLMLLPFGASTLRILRKRQAA